jgi:deoxyuridine 5'-triphosphate nucleotidohydrolase
MLMFMNVARIGDHPLPVPERQTEFAAGYDLQAAADFLAPPLTVVKVPTGFAWEIDPMAGMAHHKSIIPSSTMGKIFDRSGKISDSLMVLAGVIDADYRGEVMVKFLNFTDEPYEIKQGDRIAQLVLYVNYRLPVKEVVLSELTETGRGANGFGHTGR